MSTLSLPARQPGLRRDATLIGLVGLAHGISHFSQLVLPPLFPWLKDVFQVSYTQLGFLLTVFFVTSCVVQMLSGFWVDRFGPRPILFGGLALLGLASLGYALSTSYWMMMFFAVVAGTGNGVFHPADYTLINRKVAKTRLGHAYSVHGITGSLGWALAPIFMVSLTLAYSWRVALACAGALALAVLLVLWVNRRQLQLAPGSAQSATASNTGAAPPSAGSRPAQAAADNATFEFLKLPAVWMCFAFFFFYAGALSVVQTFAPEAARQLHDVPAHLAAICLSLYMVCSACGMAVGGFLAKDPQRSARIVGLGFGVAAVIAVSLGFLPVPGLAVPAMFGAMGLAAGLAGPSRDLLVKSSAPDNASGRVYGVVYSGLDIGQAVVPLGVGYLMDHHAYSSVWAVLAVLQGVLIISAFNIGRVRRTALAPA